MLFHLFYSIPLLLFSISTQTVQLVTTHSAYDEYSSQLPVMTLPRKYHTYFKTIKTQFEAIGTPKKNSVFEQKIPFDALQDTMEQATCLHIDFSHIRKAYRILQDDNFYTNNDPGCVHDIWTQHIPNLHDVAALHGITHYLDLTHKPALCRLSKLAHVTGLVDTILDVCALDIKKNKRNSDTFGQLKTLYSNGDAQLRKHIDDRVYADMLYSSKEFQQVNFNKPATTEKWLNTPEYELFDWQYAQAEKDSIDRNGKWYDWYTNPNVPKMSIGRMTALVLKNTQNVVCNLQTNKDKAHYAQNIPISSMDNAISNKIVHSTSSLHDVFLVPLDKLNSNPFKNLSYSHMPLISKLYSNKKYGTCNFGETNKMKFFDVDYAAFNQLPKEGNIYGENFVFYNTNVTFSKSALSKMYDIELKPCNKNKIFIYKKSHIWRNWARRIRNGIVGASCSIALLVSTVYLWDKFDTWKENIYSSDIQKQYAAFPNKSTFDFCIHNWEAFTGSELPSYITSLAAHSNTMPTSHSAIKQCCAIINNNQSFKYPITSILAYLGISAEGIIAGLVALTTVISIVDSGGPFDWKEDPLAVINIRSDQLCE